MATPTQQILMQALTEHMPPHQPPPTTGSLRQELGFDTPAGKAWSSSDDSGCSEASEPESHWPDDALSTQGASSMYSRKSVSEHGTNVSATASAVDSLVTESTIETLDNVVDVELALNRRRPRNRKSLMSCSALVENGLDSGLLNLHWDDDDNDSVLDTAFALFPSSRSSATQLYSLGAEGVPRPSWTHPGHVALRGQRSAFPQSTLRCQQSMQRTLCARPADLVANMSSRVEPASEVLPAHNVRRSSVEAGMQPGSMLGCLTMSPESISPQRRRSLQPSRVASWPREGTFQREAREQSAKTVTCAIFGDLSLEERLQDTLYTCSRADFERLGRPAQGGA